MRVVNVWQRAIASLDVKPSRDLESKNDAYFGY